MDQDSAYMSSLMTYLLAKFNIKIRTVAPYNHQSLQAEHGIKSLSTILTKHLTNLGQMWPKYLLSATFAYHMFNTPNLGNYIPYWINLWQETKTTVKFRFKSRHQSFRNIQRILWVIKQKIEIFTWHSFKSKRLAMINKTGHSSIQKPEI